MNSIFSRMGAVYRVLRRTFGVKVIPLFIAVFFGFVRTVVAIAMALDHVFFPRLREDARQPADRAGRQPAHGDDVPAALPRPTRGSARGWSCS